MIPPEQGLPSENLVGSARDILAAAQFAYRRNELKRADEILRQVVEAEPDLAPAWYLRGLVARRRKDPVQACAYFAAAVSREPKTIVYCRDFAASLIEQGRHHEALDVLERVAAMAPDDLATHFHLGNTLLRLGRPGEATGHYEIVAARDPASAEARSNLAAALRACGRVEDAIASAEAALAIRPDHAEALNNLGLALCDARRYPEAVDRLELALSLSPGNAELLNNAGVAMHAAGRLQEAECRLRAALGVRPGWGEASLNLGNLLRQEDRLEEAIEHYRQSLAADPIQVRSYGNLGLALLNLNQVDEAIAIYEKALALAPDNADIRVSLGIAQLMKGDYAAGWRNYEWRWQAPSFTSRKRTFGSPLWSGGSAAGMRILVHAEQGFGDTLQFCRYIPLLASRGADVVFECQRPLLRLCGSLDGVSRLVPRGDPLPEHDAHVPLLSLPGLFGTTLETVPVAMPYLHPPPHSARAWRERIQGSELAVGIVWTGDPMRQDDTKRSLPKSALAPLLAVRGVRFFSLQVGDQPDSSTPGLIDLADGFTDFADTAGAIDALDLTITVDTAVAHLAGALGRPVWVMLGVQADWRYLMDREDAPWYPTMRLFRRRRGDTGEALVAQVAVALRQWTDNDPRESADE